MVEKPSYDEMDQPDQERKPWEHWAAIKRARFEAMGFTRQWEEAMGKIVSRKGNENMNSWPDNRRPMTQSEHELWNASHYPGTRQQCPRCDQPTDRC